MLRDKQQTNKGSKMRDTTISFLFQGFFSGDDIVHFVILEMENRKGTMTTQR